MFQSTAIPGILPARPVKGTVVVARRREKVHASMTANNPGEAHEESVPDDAQALTALYEQFRRPIHSYIYRLLGNQEDADDVTQEVFVRACLSWNGLYERNNLSAWLYRIATNLCVDQLRRRKRISWWPLISHNPHDESSEGTLIDDGSWLL